MGFAYDFSKSITLSADFVKAVCASLVRNAHKPPFYLVKIYKRLWKILKYPNKLLIFIFIYVIILWREKIVEKVRCFYFYAKGEFVICTIYKRQAWEKEYPHFCLI